MRTRQVWRTAHSPIVYECERYLQINASADTVWDWMADARRLLSLNIFHVAVPYPEPVMQAGLCIPIMQHIWGLYRQLVSRVCAPTVSILWRGEKCRSTVLTDFRTASHSQSYRSTSRLVSSSIVYVDSSAFLGHGTGSCPCIGI